MLKNTLNLIAVIIFLSGCSIYHINTQDVSNDYYPSKTSGVEIEHLDVVSQSHDVVGYVTVNTERRQSGTAVIEKMKKQAAYLGGDAITNIETDATGIWKRIPLQKVIGNGYIRANFKATVVAFR